jgi:hypothetical protein
MFGTIFLLVCLIRTYNGDFTPEAHVGFEAAAWYWHFVDVVWLFLFATIYVWGASCRGAWGATSADPMLDIWANTKGGCRGTPFSFGGF